MKYDPLGRPIYASVPYSAGSSGYAAPAWTALAKTETQYDLLDRPTRVLEPD